MSTSKRQCRNALQHGTKDLPSPQMTILNAALCSTTPSTTPTKQHSPLHLDLVEGIAAMDSSAFKRIQERERENQVAAINRR